MTGEKEIMGIFNGFHFSICQFESGGSLLSSYGESRELFMENFFLLFSSPYGSKAMINSALT